MLGSEYLILRAFNKLNQYNAKSPRKGIKLKSKLIH